MCLLKKIEKDSLTVQIYDSREAMGNAAGKKCAEVLRKLLNEKDVVNMIFAAAPSQNETLEALVNEKDIDWTRVRAFHMDEYIGLSKDAPQGFGNFLDRAIFSKLPFKEVYYLRDYDTPEEVCKNYSQLLKDNPVDIVCLGIGENGHIAFNDPHIAYFDDIDLVKIVDLDEKCRLQQVHDGCFNHLDLVPKYAVTLTIPALTNAKCLICTVPSHTKAEAVKHTIEDEISEKCPATIMRRHNNATMFLDKDSAKLVL